MLHCPTCGRLFEADVRTCPHDGATLQADSTIAAPSLSDPLVGRVLDEKYRLDRRLGEGGMGTVYQATHLLIERPVAVKVLHQRFVEDEAAQERFRREARAAGRLRHTNAVTVTDFGRTSDGCVYIVMELLEGRNLRELLAFESPLESGRAVALMAQVAAAVEAAHESGVIHRDLKPANIFIVQPKNAPPLVKVLDFGIAKLAAESVDDSEQHALTLTGVMIGTPRYMSPEQCDGAHLTPASDVYSLGIILYEMLTGATPFTGASPLAVALQHSSKPPRRPTELVANIPPELERVVLHALEKNPLNRPPDAGAFRRELLAAAKVAGIARAHDYLAAEEFENGNGALESTGRFVIGETSGGQHGNGKASDTTRLADATGRHAPQTGSVAAAVVTDAHATPAAPTRQEAHQPEAQPFTRIKVLLQDRRTLLERLSRPPVLFAAAVVLLGLVIGLTAFVRTRNSSGATVPVENATLAATPTPTPEATPTPTPEETVNRKAQPVKNNRRASRTANRGKEKKESKVGSAFKKLKKVLNPF
jgi:eukaryotic-like serine/threonine-protein kinase